MTRADIMASTDPIERSFELAAERCEDLTPLVHRRLFSERPEAGALQAFNSLRRNRQNRLD
jgi:hypothetical protein